MEGIKLTKAQVRRILSITFPEYKGRKFSLRFGSKYYPQNYWDGGSKTFFKCLTSTPEGVKTASWGFNPMRRDAHDEFDIPVDGMIVEHIYFCGHDLGINIIVNPQSPFVPKMIKEA